ncbi:MAG: ATP-binding protein [Candidatus Omnitrophota bacterium]
MPEGLTVHTDPNILDGIIRNLTNNAVKFTPKGGKILVTAELHSNNSVEISIKDTGIGMNSHLIDNLFRLDCNTSRKGTEGESSTGMGLIICRDLVKKLGGELHIKSEEGKGSKFMFTIPALKIARQ